MYYAYGPYGAGFGFLAGLIWLIVIIIVISVIVRLVRGPRHHHWHEHGGHSRATDILRERYAKGEITKDQFDQMKKDINARDDM